MLVRDSVKRYTIPQIKAHKWMIHGEPSGTSKEPLYIEDPDTDSQLNEKIINKMESLGMDREKTVQVRI